jgi:hypothetical protein
MIDTDTGKNKSLFKEIEVLARKLPPSKWDMFAPVLEAAEKKEKGCTLRMLGKAGHGKTALMQALIYGARPEKPVDIESSKFETTITFKRQTPFELPPGDHETSFQRDLTCAMTKAEQEQRLAELYVQKAEEGLDAAEVFLIKALEKDYPDPLSVQLGTLEAVQEDQERMRQVHCLPGLLSQYTVGGELGVAGVELIDCCGLGDSFMDNEGKLANQLQESDMVLITIGFVRFEFDVKETIKGV